MLLAQANAIRIPLPHNAVHAVITSPPYWGQRSYLAPGDSLKEAELGTESLHDCGGWVQGESCGECYVCHMRSVFAEVWRVLRDDGVLWLNLGESYAGYSTGSQGAYKTGLTGGLTTQADAAGKRPHKLAPGLKPKDLSGTPWRVALALQADGWYLRTAVPWLKPNAMPDSANDRPGLAHEHLFLLSKSSRYYYDYEAVLQPSGRRQRTTDFMPYEKLAIFYEGYARHIREIAQTGGALAGPDGVLAALRVNTRPYHGAHFATYPPQLIEDAMRVATSDAGVCSECGAPWERVTEQTPGVSDRRAHELYEQSSLTPEHLAAIRAQDAEGNITQSGAGHTAHIQELADEAKLVLGGYYREFLTALAAICWRPTCTCGAPENMQPHDTDIICSPTGSVQIPGPTATQGRRGLGRTRTDTEGTRCMTRYEQRQYAAQLRNSPQRAMMAEQAGAAFAHYIRTDTSGARCIPPDLLQDWTTRGWLERVALPHWKSPTPVPATVLDPFAGSGTTLLVARQLGRRSVGLDLSHAYLAEQASERLGLRALREWKQGKQQVQAQWTDTPLFSDLRNRQ